MSAELVKAAAPAASLPDMIRYAEHLAEANLLPRQYQQRPANVLYAMEYGRTLGITPLAAITGIHVIEGKPSASAALISGLVRQAGHKLRVTGNGQSATAQIIRSDDPEFTYSVTWELRRNANGNPSAEEAGLLNKDVWKKYAASMLKARAISQVARDACEEVLFGLHYTPEELSANVSEDGTPVDAEVQQLRRVQPGEGDPWATPADAERSRPAAVHGRSQTAQDFVTAAAGATDPTGVKEIYRQANAAGLLAETVKAPDRELLELGAYLIARGQQLAEPKPMSDAEIAADTARARQEMYQAAETVGLTARDADQRFKSDYDVDSVYGTAEQLRAVATGFASTDDIADVEVVAEGETEADTAERDLRAAAATAGLDNLDEEFERSYGLPIAEAGAPQLREMTALLTGTAA